MKMLLIIVLILILSFWTGYSYELFITSEPINALVFSGEERLGSTPLRLKGISKESINLTIKKKGFEDIQEEVYLQDLENRMLFYTLSPLNISIVLNQKDKDLYLNDIKAGKTPLIIDNISSGTYKIDSKEGVISIKNSEYSMTTRTALVEALFSASLLGVSIAGIAYFNQNQDTLNAHAMGFSTIIFGGILGYNLLKLYKAGIGSRKDRATMSTVEIKPYRGVDDRNIFSSGMEFIGREQWKEAITKFILVINLYSDSQYVPISVYETGYCYYEMGNYPKAREYFKKFVYEYPIYELFPYGVSYLLDIEMRLGEPDEALKDYNSLKPIYLEDESGELIKEFYDIYLKLFLETDEKNHYILHELLGELDRFLTTYMDSSAYSEIYFLKGKLLYQYLDREKGILVFNDIEEKYSYDKSLISKIESILYE